MVVCYFVGILQILKTVCTFYKKSLYPNNEAETNQKLITNEKQTEARMLKNKNIFDNYFFFNKLKNMIIIKLTFPKSDILLMLKI